MLHSCVPLISSVEGTRTYRAPFLDLLESSAGTLKSYRDCLRCVRFVWILLPASLIKLKVMLQLQIMIAAPQVWEVEHGATNMLQLQGTYIRWPRSAP